jgi:hypothetical protein
MFETILSVLGSAAGGSFIGMIGTAIKGFQEYKDRQAERRHELEMRRLDQSDMRLEAELAIKQTEVEFTGKAHLADIEGAVARDVAAAELQGKSYDNDKAEYSKGVLNKLSGIFGNMMRSLLVFVDVARGMMRPSITVYLIIIESLICYQLYQLLLKFNAPPAEETMKLFIVVVNSVVFLTATAVTWWFGSRPNQQRT